MGKYEELRKRLQGPPDGAVELTFTDIDRVVGGLPRSARKHRAWWSNERQGTHVQCAGWLDAGRRVEDVDLNAGRVRFSSRQQGRVTPAPRDEYAAFAGALRELLTGEERFERASGLARRYWSDAFTGRYFHELADRDRPNAITAADIAAVSTLGVTIPGAVVIWLLRDGRDEVSALLEDIPTDVDIWDAGERLARGGALWTLWDLLLVGCWPAPKPANGMHRTKISKLLATKRPRLVPIYDTVLEKLLPPVANYWTAFERALGDEELRLLLSIAAGGGAPEGAGLLRRVDAMLWMIGREPPPSSV